MKIKRAIALVLVLVMSLGILSVSASAADEKPEFVIRDGILYEYNGPGGVVVVPDGVVQVWRTVFEDDTSITSVTFPEGCKRVDTGFRCCTSLVEVICPYSVEYIHIDYPAHLTALRKVVIPNEWADVSEWYSQCGTLLIDENGNITQAEPPQRPTGTYKITLSVPSFDGAPSPIIHGTTKVVRNGERYGEFLEILDMSGFHLPNWRHPVWRTPSGEIVTPDSIVNVTSDTVITLCQDPAYDKPEVNLDNSMSSWAKADIEAALAAGLLTDELKSGFQSAITRNEFCMLMCQLIKAKTGMSAGAFVLSKGIKVGTNFKDVSSYTYIYPAYALGIMNRTSTTTFNPNGTVTNKEAADMFSRAAMVLGLSYSGSSNSTGNMTREQAIVETLKLYNARSSGQGNIPTFEDNQDNNQNQNNNQNSTANTLQQKAEAEWNRVKNSKGYSQYYYNLNTEFLAKGVDPQYYEHTIVTDDVQAKSDEICAGLSTDREKVAAIHKWVTENIYYDYEALYSGSYPPRPAQYILDRRAGVCSGYTILTQALCWAQGIPAVYICGGSTNGYHAWNLVQLDGKWQWLDATWDTFNAYYGGNAWNDGSKRNDYFLCPTEFISKDHWVNINKSTDGPFAINGINANLPSQSYQVTQQLIKQEEERLKSDEYLKEVKKAVETDGSMSSWAKTEINEAAELGLVPGDIMNNFTNKITREEFCALMVKLVEANSGKDIASYVSSKGKTLSAPFTDSDTQEVKAAYALGIVNGVSATKFNPSGSITRQEAAAMLERTAKVLGLTSGTGLSFSDSDKIASWAKGSVAFVSGLTDPVTGGRVMGGTGSGFSPLGTYTREQAIATALRLFHCAG